MGLLPEGLLQLYAGLERYGFIILFALIWLGVFDRLLWPMVGVVIKLMGAG